MSEERVILHGVTPSEALCVDDIGKGVLLTPRNNSDCDGQVFLPISEALRLGEWLIERANGAEKPEVVGLPMLVKNSRGWEVLGEDGTKFRLALMSAAPFERANQAGEK